MSDVCKHCTNAGCLDACPTGALIRTEFGTVVLQPDVCNGCGYCVPACPFGVVDRDHDDGRAAKCTLCYDRLEDGLEPACAKACPTDSIQFGPLDELREVAAKRSAALHERGVDARLPLRRRRRARGRAGRRPRRVLPAHRAARELRAAGAGRLADPGERHARHADRGGRRAAGRRRAWPPRSCGSGGDERLSATPRRPVGVPGASRRSASRTRREGRPAHRPVEGRPLVVPVRGGHEVRRRDAGPRGDPRGRRSARAPDRCRTRSTGPVIKAPVWTWEVPLYFWFGGIAAGLVVRGAGLRPGRRRRSRPRWRARSRSARWRRRPPLLIIDLGRPERFYNMLRIFKPRSPMSMGAWALTAFGNLAAAGGRRGPARPAPRGAALGAANAVVGGYLGSYTGVLLASTAVPVWARSRLFLGPIFVSTATATGAAACRLALVAPGAGRPPDPRRRSAASRWARWPPSSRCRRSTSAGSARSRAASRPAARAGSSRPPSGRCAPAWRAGRAAAIPRPARRLRALPRRRTAVPLRLGQGRPAVGARRPGGGRDGALTAPRRLAAQLEGGRAVDHRQRGHHGRSRPCLCAAAGRRCRRG